MTYNINFYCAAGGISPDEAIDLLVDSFNTQSRPVFTDDRSSGQEWTSVSLGSTESAAVAGGTRIEFHSSPSIVRHSVSQVAAEDISGRINETDSLLIITLSGDGIDLPVVQVVWESATSLWNAIPHDDASGFEVAQAEFG
ncbi:hypothetical protein [Streptomyces litchfieldiae]|uniref:Uncharacterized protein n=1 Tax=Streptomyces litchfieldiae TaxID=3075543 RepID=A0ABU2MYQ3_9ACTN|nr:hypothetical protein [Streptomyces sp. DSM 44938]MDT0346775.1 hypothetical protein [Streptomyces sp. DSM 44938]